MGHHREVTRSFPWRAAIALAVVFLVLTTAGWAAVSFGGGALSSSPVASIEQPAPLLPEPATQAAPAPPNGDQATTQGAAPGGVDPTWVTRTAQAAGIPEAAVRAYANAQLRLAAEQPQCRLGWNTLAGLGWVESHHGTIGGRTLLADGTSSTPILGPELNGAGKVAAIRATPESSAWHGNPTWEHAVGPLQFLHSSWERWGADGDSDGQADPRDLDDAAVAAGRYLCADRHDLSTSTDWSKAVFSYNHSADYVRDVAAAANTYAERTR